MALTADEETILKLMIADVKARAKLNAVNTTMGQEIRTEFNTIDAAIREKYRAAYEALEADVQAAQVALKTEASK